VAWYDEEQTAVANIQHAIQAYQQEQAKVEEAVTQEADE
jgi:hypothetical protein